MEKKDSLGKEFDSYINTKVKEFIKEEDESEYDNVFTDTFSELIDKLCIVHIRYWNFENDIATEEDPLKVMEIKKKSEVLFKKKRPQLVEAIDKMFLKVAKGDIEYKPSNLKNYKGWNK